MKTPLLLLLIIFIAACCPYNKKDFDFSAEESNLFGNYKPGDTLYFQSTFGDIDTIIIADTGSERIENHCGFMSPKPENSKWIRIRQPRDNKEGNEEPYQELLLVNKSPTVKKTYFSIIFRNLHSESYSTPGEFHADTIHPNGLRFSNYYIINDQQTEKITDPKDIIKIYWSAKDGLIGYQTRDYKFWTRKTLNKTERSVPDSLIYTVINAFVRDISEEYRGAAGEPFIIDQASLAGLVWLQGIDSTEIVETGMFSKEDFFFIRKQIQDRDAFRYNNRKIEKMRLVSYDSILKYKNNKDYHKLREMSPGGTYHIDIPLFSCDFKTVVINYEYSCGALCGHLNCDIYVKKNGKWVFRKRILKGVS